MSTYAAWGMLYPMILRRPNATHTICRTFAQQSGSQKFKTKPMENVGSEVEIGFPPALLELSAGLKGTPSHTVNILVYEMA